MLERLIEHYDEHDIFKTVNVPEAVRTAIRTWKTPFKNFDLAKSRSAAVANVDISFRNRIPAGAGLY